MFLRHPVRQLRQPRVVLIGIQVLEDHLDKIVHIGLVCFGVGVGVGGVGGSGAESGWVFAVV
ncbi:hypothetical protein, partial [Amycolatopsis minnesotensis]|uniref:hypothetical protein n=1 Tax=Amycolatopsis minnesotensis TaxID=337894 RepID=UPI0031D96850